uniref:Pancreatic trypsin inhibitor n=1 Tax=Rhipicephalus appendiculatus TaxID=34631 RepID=A0A131YRQ9_RHIAP
MSRISIIMAFVVVVYAASALGSPQQKDTNTTDGESLNTTPRNRSKINGTVTNKKRRREEQYLCRNGPSYGKCRASFIEWFYIGGRCTSYTGCVSGGFKDPDTCETVCVKSQKRTRRPRPRPKETTKTRRTAE